MIPLFLPLLWLIMVLPLSSSLQQGLPIAKPGCRNQCGDVTIPYPFGVGAGCFYDPYYEIVCNNNSKPLLRKYNLEVINIAWPKLGFVRSDERTVTVRIPVRNICGSDIVRSVNFSGSPYRFSIDDNVFMVKGCAGSVVVKYKGGKILGGCTSFCANSNIPQLNTSTKCPGLECCRSSLLDPNPNPKLISVEFYEIAIDHTALSSDTCTLVGGLIKIDAVDKFYDTLSPSPTYPVLLFWDATFLTENGFNQHDNFTCSTFGSSDGRCSCEDYYEGNPYLPNGCQVVRPCHKCKHHCDYTYHSAEDSSSRNKCKHHCDYTYRSTEDSSSRNKCKHHCDYTYRSAEDSGNQILRFHCVNPMLKQGPILGFSIGMGLIVLLVCSYWLYRVIKKKREVRRKAKFFKRNGGLLLQKHMTSTEGAFEKTKIFCTTELEKATNNFDKDRILGQGGQGTVYKGMLTDGKILAVKKSKLVDEGQLESFINELVILSQINHRNVVKVLGCCLETEVPLLVYEYISNGTLYHLLHAPTDDFHVTWKMRLQIAAESADALVYLHSSSATPIYHRDIKSSNILLDEKYRAKVSDFGTSKSITIEQTHVTTCVMGTYGYLDPEYFQSNQFTDKSDVYSFGVVLVELITCRKPLRPVQSGGWISLASEFLSHMETSRLFDILDARVLDEGKEEEFIAVAKLATRCLNMSGKLRPSMKEVAVVLDGIRTRKLFNLKEARLEEETQFVDTETSNVGCTPFRTNTFSSVNGPGSSRSTNVEPLMPFTF